MKKFFTFISDFLKIFLISSFATLVLHIFVFPFITIFVSFLFIPVNNFLNYGYFINMEYIYNFSKYLRYSLDLAVFIVCYIILVRSFNEDKEIKIRKEREMESFDGEE